jgi:hypothetical protein
VRGALGQRHFVEHVELGFALDVEAGDAGRKGLAHFGAGLADAREDDLLRIGAHGQHAGQFAARDDVEAAAGFGEHAQHAERRVGLHGVADQGVAAFEAALVGGQRVEHPLLRIDEQRRAVFARQGVEGQPFDMKGAVAVGNVGMAGEGGVRHLGAPLPVVAAAGALLAAAGLGAASLDEERLELPGVINCGRVARWAAAGSFGRYNAPRWPQAASPTAAAAMQTMSTVRPRAVTRIWRTFNIAKL